MWLLWLVAYTSVALGCIALALIKLAHSYRHLQNRVLYLPQLPAGSTTSLDDPANFGVNREWIEIPVPTPPPRPVMTSDDSESVAAPDCCARHPTRVGVEEISPDTTLLRGFISFPSAGPAPTSSSHHEGSRPGSAKWLLYLHGNAGNVGHRIPVAKLFHQHIADLTVVMVDYRGYGLSDGGGGPKGRRQLTTPFPNAAMSRTGGRRLGSPRPPRESQAGAGARQMAAAGGATPSCSSSASMITPDDEEVGPTEQGLRQDAQAILDFLFDSGRIVEGTPLFVMGTSLGGAVAAQLAAVPRNARRITGLVLENSWTTISDMTDVVFEPKVRSYLRRPWIANPVVGWLRHVIKPLVLMIQWDTVGTLPHVTVPCLVLVGGKDEIIPPSHSRRLFEVAGSAAVPTPMKRMKEFDKGGHNNLALEDGYCDALRAFIDECMR